ncbi:MAG: C69 family dipeptidase [Bacteroidaceae bacterium]|nr:C69 family dipeptidase [Bacteroidaceae bacterium]
MKRFSSILLAALAAPIVAMACTGLIAGRNATVDGSVMITYSADSHSLYGSLTSTPAGDWQPGDVRQIVDWDSGKPLGAIPQIPHTYAVIGNMNECALAITESTWGGRPELEDSTGIIDYGTLIQLGLERASTAREALKVMTDLVAEYGYYSSGESFSIADKEEAWVLEMIGKGPGRKGAVWVAVRIPDDCISGHANQARIHQFPLDDPENCIYSSDVISFAREMGYYKGEDKNFSFSSAYAPLDYGALRGCDARVWSFFNRFASGMDKYLSYLENKGGEVMPLYVRPDRKLSLRDMKDAMRDHFDGTPYDMHNDVGGGPFGSPYRYRPMYFTVNGKEYLNERAIATQQTAFTLVAQMRPNLPAAISGILWFGVDDANTAVYVPMYCSSNEVPECFSPENGDLYNFSWTSAFWVHNWVANMAYNRYNPMIGDIRNVQKNLEDQFEEEVLTIDELAEALYTVSEDAARELLTTYSCQSAEFSTATWKELGEFLMVKFLDGNVKSQNPDGSFVRNEYGLPTKVQFPGYSKEYYEEIVSTTGKHLLVKKIK